MKQIPQISRRSFIAATGAASLFAFGRDVFGQAGVLPAGGRAAGRPGIVGALYFRAHLYTIVPRHVREDMEWLRDAGTDLIVIGVLEQDFEAARENIDLICAEAARAGLKVWATPSRWGNLVAGSPKVPSVFVSKRPECSALKKNGAPWMGMLGPYASIHHAVTLERFEKMTRQLLEYWPVEGIIWDEPKSFDVVDHSAAAKKAFGGESPDDVRAHRRALAKFYGRMNGVAKRARSVCHTSMFTYGMLNREQIDDLADQPDLDSFGCDGRPWALADRGPGDSNRSEPARKCLLDDGPRFIASARAHGKKSFALIENHALPAAGNPLMERRLPEVLAQGWDVLMYYYYPRSCEEPDVSMGILRRQLGALKRG